MDSLDQNPSNHTVSCYHTCTATGHHTINSQSCQRRTSIMTSLKVIEISLTSCLHHQDICNRLAEPVPLKQQCMPLLLWSGQYHDVTIHINALQVYEHPSCVDWHHLIHAFTAPTALHARVVQLPSKDCCFSCVPIVCRCKKSVEVCSMLLV